MFEVFRVRPSIVLEAGKARFQPIFIIQILIFFAVFIITQIASAIPLVIVMLFKIFISISSGLTNKQQPALGTDFLNNLESNMALPMLFSTIVATALVIIYCRFIEKRSLYSMGFVRNKAVKSYLTGLLTGFAMFSACVLIAALTGTLTYNGIILGNSIGLLFVFLLGFLFQGLNEEVMLRGYFMISIATKTPLLVAVLASSILFALMHLLNNGISVLALLNLTLFGIFASVYVLRTNNIWGICAIHSVWNFVQGNIYGIPVSGVRIESSVLSFLPTKTGALINGGTFGLEGGLAVTIVLLVSIIAAMTIGSKRNH